MFVQSLRERERENERERECVCVRVCLFKKVSVCAHERKRCVCEIERVRQT